MEKALPAASKAVEIDPQNPENLTTLAQVYLLLDDRIQAIELLQSALAIDQDYARAHFLLGMAYLYQGQTEDAREHLVKASENAQDSATLEQAQRAIRYYLP
jgi:tetratricopeptide (TPR) repeat protein